MALPRPAIVNEFRPEAERPFVHNTALAFISQVVRYGLMTAAWAIVARIAGASGLGQIQLAYTFCAWMVLFLGFGIPVANIYFIGRRIYSASDVLGNSLWIIAGQTLLALAVLIGLRRYLIRLVPLSPVLYQMLLWWIPLQLLSSQLTSILSARKQFAEQCWINIVQGSFLAAALSSLALLKGSVPALMACLISATGVTILLQLWFLRNHLLSSRFAPSSGLLRDSASMGMKGYLANLSQAFTYRLDTFVVSYYLGSSTLGIYALAYSTGEMLWYLPSTFATVLLPTTASSPDAVSNLRTAQLSRLLTFFGLIAGAGGAVLAPWVLPLIAGPTFSASVPLLWALLPGIVLFMVEKVISADLTGRGYLKYASYGSLIAFTGTVILDLLLIPRYGVMAAAVSSSLIYTVETVYLIERFCAVSGVRWRDLFFFTRSDFKVVKEVLFTRPVAFIYRRYRLAA